ncbi:hypothetical protein SAMN04488120_11343 [Fontimonas thermophila]|uniref:Uncharacterized protein n=1 Tax=Fontimonas thermophila TaxID=1076937 RepID=A0A1I2KBA1_9GAMM|nr:hypothetical protein SAMN04488120_11343 [Fontimonas thermophila]
MVEDRYVSEAWSGVGIRGTSAVTARSGTAATLFQGLLYSGVVTGLLVLIVRAYGEQLSTPYRVLALLAAAFSFLMLGRFDLLAAWHMGRPGSIGT